MIRIYEYNNHELTQYQSKLTLQKRHEKVSACQAITNNMKKDGKSFSETVEEIQKQLTKKNRK